MILFDNRTPLGDRLVLLQIFKRLNCLSCKSSTGTESYAGFSFDIKEFNSIIRANFTQKTKREIATQTCEDDFLEAARANSPSMIRRRY